MRIPRLRSVVALAAVAAIALGGCGGGGDDSEGAFEGETVTSSDGVLTVQVPEGVVAEGAEVTIALLEDGDLPSELRGADPGEFVIVGYELGPDGAEFAEPVVVTFRIDPGEVGLDLPEGALPVGLLLTQTADGELEGVGGELRLEDSDVVAQATLTHFSPAIVVLSTPIAVVLNPPKKELEAGDRFLAEVGARDLRTGEDALLSQIPELYERAVFDSDPGWEAVAPFSIVAVDSAERQAVVTCTARTEGWVPDAYEVLVRPGTTLAEAMAAALVGDTNLFGGSTESLGVRLVGEGKCNAAEETPTPSGSSDDGGGSSVALNGADADGQASGDIAGAVGGCKDGESKHADCVPFIDITGVRWGPVAGSENLVEIAVTLGGPPPEGAFADHVVTVKGTERGSGTPIVQEQIRVLVAGLTCESFRGGEPGETCEVLAADQFVITVDVSELTFPLEIELFSMHNTTDGRIGDHYVVEDIGE